MRRLSRLRHIHEGSRGVIGAPPMHEDLLDEGERVRLDRVARLMAADGLQGWSRRQRRRFGRPTIRPVGVRHLLERDFTALAPERQWVTDITEVATQEGRFFLCVVLDLYGKLVIG